ncbi:hypothetical protein TNCV_3482301 [Trichonephila clavipes]|nr:hypothetical protein TNCV_3482301 [Trichonephila clavipes]
MTRLQSCHTPVARVGKNPVDTAYDVGSVVNVLADVGSSSQLRSVVSLMVSLDGTGCLEGAGGIRRRVLRTDDGGKPNRLAASGTAGSLKLLRTQSLFHFDSNAGCFFFEHGRLVLDPPAPVFSKRLTSFRTCRC